MFIISFIKCNFLILALGVINIISNIFIQSKQFPLGVATALFYVVNSQPPLTPHDVCICNFNFMKYTIA